MKRSLLLLSLSVLFASDVIGQCQPDTTLLRPGIYPDSATGLLPAYATYPYHMVISVLTPVDTILPGLPRMAVDSIGVLQIIGLPAGFTAVTDSPSGFWRGNKRGCMLISGTPNKQQVGTYPLLFKLAGYVGSIPLPLYFDLTSYNIKVLDSAAYSGIDEQKLLNNPAFKILPNPVGSSFTLQVNAGAPENYDLLIYDVNSRLVKTEMIETTEGPNHFSFDATTLRPGVYFCRLRKTNGTLSGSAKMIKY